MTEDELGSSVLQALRELDAPPEPPREEMWARIQAQRTGRGSVTETRDVVSDDSRRDVIDLRPRRRSSTWLQVGAALAAMLVLGIGIGRFTRVESGATSAPAASAPPSADAIASSYRLAATQHLRRTEVLLTSLNIDADARSAQEMRTWASELLTNTRLLLASPAADDAATKTLLEELELVLSQIAVMPTAQAREEMELIQNGLNQSDVLPRLRAATTGRRLVGT